MESISPRRGPLIIYVDDERANRVVFEYALIEFNVLTVSDARAALALLDVHDVAVLVTDMRMPGMNGEDLLRIVKEKYPQTIRMVVTAYSDVDPILRAINGGLVARYIIKPWQRAELIQVLRWACEAWTYSRDSAALYRRLLETDRFATLGHTAGMLINDLQQPLMSLTTHLENLGELAQSAPHLAMALGHLDLQPEAHERLIELLVDLIPLSDGLKDTILHLTELLKGLRELGAPQYLITTDPIIDPLPAVHHTMALCQELAMHAHTAIAYDGPQELPRVRMSRTAFTQIMVNVVVNGVQAVAARGGEHGKVSIAARRTPGMLELQIHDDGIGMSPEVLRCVGVPFFTTNETGEGLGISQCQRLIGAAGGRFHIESKQGSGTTVTITLPTAA